MSTFTLREPRQIAISVGRAPLIAAGSFAGVVCVFVLVQAAAALSSTGIAKQEQGNSAAVAVVAPAIVPNPLSCDQQTWPYIERRCIADASNGAKRLVRVISPERAPTPEIAASDQAALPAAPEAASPSDQQPPAQSFAALSPQATPGAVEQEFVRTRQTPAAAAQQDAVAPRGAERRGADVKQPKIAKPRLAPRTPSLAPRVAERRPAVRRFANQDRMAQANGAEAARVSYTPDIAHGLY